MNSVQFNVRLLETYTLQTRNETRNKFKCAIKNLKRRKRYNKRIMNPKICKLKKNLDEFLKTTECKDYFMNCALISSIINEEIIKSPIKAVTYTKKTRGVKRQRLNNDDEEEEEGEEEEEEEEDDPEEESNSQEEQQLEEVSFITDSTDDSYIFAENILIADDKLPTKKSYYLSMLEISTGNSKPCNMESDITVEERYALSSIVCSQRTENILPYEFQTMLKEFRKAIKYNTDMDLALISLMSKKEQVLTCMLMFAAETLKKEKEILPMALSKKVNYGRNGEFNFIIKQVAFLIESIINSLQLHLEWDATSNVYLDCQLKVQQCRHDFILYTNDGTEIGTGEIKPHNANSSAVDLDLCRIAESLKKQLHKRLLLARSETEAVAYGIMVYGDMIESKTMNLTTYGKYIYTTIYDATLPTSNKTYAFMEETLEILIQFISLAEKSLITPEEFQNELVMPLFSRFLKPTVMTTT